MSLRRACNRPSRNHTTGAFLPGKMAHFFAATNTSYITVATASVLTV
jgi:hypothetical protein